jgi:hypothetical protein
MKIKTTTIASFKRGGRPLAWALLAAMCVLFLIGCCSELPLKSSSDISAPKEISPCAYPEYWPYSKASSKFPFIVHYSSESEHDTAVEIIALLEKAWQRQLVEQKYEPPPSDTGLCGPDGRFDVFIRRGVNSCKVDLVTEQFVTKWGGRASYMEVDPWGSYGGSMLGATIAHEFNHATHAANDWYDLPIAFEMSASYVDQFYGPLDLRNIIDFQKHPDWGLLRNDSYLTYYMYGSAIYLHFLRDRYFGVDDSFIPQLWVDMRNTPKLNENNPNFVDALNVAFTRNGIGVKFLDTIPEFARWRYYCGINDGKHFLDLNKDTRPTSLPPVPLTSQLALIAEAKLNIGVVTMPLKEPYTFDTALTMNGSRFVPAPMMTGSVYLTVKRENAAQSSFKLSLAADPSVKWVVQAVPGLDPASNGEIVDLTGGSARVSFTSAGDRTLILTVMPKVESDFEPDDQTDIRYPVSLTIEP